MKILQKPIKELSVLQSVQDNLPLPRSCYPPSLQFEKVFKWNPTYWPRFSDDEYEDGNHVTTAWSSCAYYIT